MSKTKEELILNLLKNKNKPLSKGELKDELDDKDISSTINDLLFFEYVTMNGDKIELTNKKYDEKIRKNEKRDENYEIILNKVFTGKYLNQRLAHELINFIVADDGNRYIYVLPEGTKSKGTTKYVFHIIHSSSGKYPKAYEIVGISKVDLDWKESSYRDKVENEDMTKPTYKNHTFLDIFDESKAHNYTYKAEKYYKVNEGKKVFILTGYDEANIESSNDEIVIKLRCNPQHSITYADSEGKATYSSVRNQYTDLELLYGLLGNENFISECNDNINLEDLPSEQCYSVINDRTKLEDSMSNQMAYFMMRDYNFLLKYLQDFLGINNITADEDFIVKREFENIDLLIEGKSHVVVIENKVDSSIRVDTNSKREPYKSQLSNYYDYIEKKYPNHHRRYFLLAPDYYDMTQDILNSKYKNGNKYIYKNYSELLEVVSIYSYKPNDSYSVFMFKEFVHSVEYLTWSTAKCSERTALIRLKQRINELNEKNNV